MEWSFYSVFIIKRSSEGKRFQRFSNIMDKRGSCKRGGTNLSLPFNWLNSLDVFKKYQFEIETLFRHVKWIDFMTGEMVLTEDLINKEWKLFIIEQLPEFIDDLQITLIDGLIHLHLIGQMKGLTFNACFDIAIDNFEFTANSHKLVLAIRNESVEAEHGLINKMLMSIINSLFIGLISETIIHKTIEKQPEISFDHEHKKIVIDLELLPQYQKYLEIVIFDKPLITLLKMEFMGIKAKEIKFRIFLPKPPSLSFKDVIGVLGL